MGDIEMHVRVRAKERPRLNPALKIESLKDAQVRAWTVITLFWASGGTCERTKRRGYRAWCGSSNKAALEIIHDMWKGQIVFRPVKGGKGRGYWQWTVQKKEAVEWLHKNLTALFLPPLPPPDRSICRHCGQEAGYHDQECHLALP